MTYNKYSTYFLVTSAIVLLLGDVLQVLNHDNILWTVCLAISFVLFVAGIPAVNSFIYSSNSTFKSIINSFLLIGAIAGASMQVFFRIEIILDKEKLFNAVEALSNYPSLAFTTMVPGIFFPLGLILLCIAMLLAKKHTTWKTMLLLIGAISFPVGHAIGNLIALIVGDVILICAWFLLSSEVLRTPGQTTASRVSKGDFTPCSSQNRT
jgi:hypothetical protein